MSVSDDDSTGCTPPLLNLTTHQLQYLIAVSQSPTLGDAAAKLQISQSALSQGLSELERKLGLNLFERQGRNRVLTEVGKQVVMHCERILAATRDLTIWADATAEGRQGRVRLGLIDIAAVNYFPEALIEFRAQRPDVELRLSVAPSAALTRQLMAGQLDAAVIVAPAQLDHDELVLDELLTEELAIYAPRPDQTGARRLGPPDTWGPWVTFPPESHTRRHIARALRESGAEFEVEAESHQPEVLRQMVSLGMGWTVLPVVQAEAEPNPLIRARRQPLLTRQLVIALRRGAETEPATIELIGRLKGHAKRF
ncbi:MAG: LysR family transcriptional regulator [Acidimicrobiales bacterium]